MEQSEQASTEELLGKINLGLQKHASFYSVSIEEIDAATLSLAAQTGNHHTQLIADLLAFRKHVKVKLGVDDLNFYKKLLSTLAAFGQESSKLSSSEAKQAFIRSFMTGIAQSCGKDITDIARMMQSSLMLEEGGGKLKVLNRNLWKEAFADTK